jgi:hypothetical protein
VAILATALLGAQAALSAAGVIRRRMPTVDTGVRKGHAQPGIWGAAPVRAIAL